MAITDWPKDERPREKLLLRGASALSDAELLAIFLRTGCQGKSAVDLARELLVSFGGLRPLLQANQEGFCSAKGLGKAKFAQLQAVLEMGRRNLAEKLHHTPCMDSSRSVRSFLKSALSHRESEVFTAMFLNAQHQLIAFSEIFQGTIDSAPVYPRDVVKLALKHNAAAVIFAHNHPSGHAEPSEADKAITSRLKNALELVDIRTLDHMIVGNNEIVSLAERGLV